MICVVVVLLLLAHSVSSIPIGDFFPFNGPNVCLFDTVTMMVHKDNTVGGSDGVPIEDVTSRDCEEFRLSPNDDGSSPNISISFTFPFFARRFRNLYVNTNGVVSFIEPVPQFSPDPFPITNRYLISPYWADVDIRGIGDVFFKETTDSSLLTKAKDVILSATVQARGLSRFRPRWMLIATWNNVGYFSTHTDLINTFQTLLVTDGRHSFVVFNYLDDGISWTRGDASQVDAQVGFNFGGSMLRHLVFNSSRTAAIADIEEDSNTGSPGQYVYRVDIAVIREATTGSRCDDLPILVDPDTPTIINGGTMTLSGPSFNTTSTHEKISCVFTDDDGDVTKTVRDAITKINGIIVNCKAICPMPFFRKLGSHNLTVILNNTRFVGEFEVVSAVYKQPDVHVYDDNQEVDFSIIFNDIPYRAIWDPEEFNTNQFKENGKINFTIENWAFVKLRAKGFEQWIKRGSMTRAAPPFQLLDQNYTNGSVTFKQVTDNPVRFRFDISLIVLVKKTKNLNIMYTSTILSFVPKQFTGKNAAQEYCRLWLAQSNEAIQRESLQNCPCSMTSVRLDPDFIADPTCSSPESKCHENVKSINVEANRCFLKNVNITMDLGQQCCYDSDGKYITTNRPAGSADHNIPTTSYLQHQSADYYPYKVCCIDSHHGNFCEKYYEMRPKDNGSSCSSAEQDRGNAGGNGDPHFITLDGKQYTFNGLGEYTLLDAQNGEFIINIQTKQAIDQSDRLIKATSISVIAMKMRNKPVIQAQLDEIFGIKVLVESNMTETGYRELDFEFLSSRNFNGGLVQLEEELSRNFMFENGVVIIIKASNDILSFQLSVPQTFRNNTKGLLGVWNGNQDDDFLRPDGTTISIESDESEIFREFGEQWSVDEDESLIIIEEGFSRPVKVEDFEPLFMTPVVDVATARMINETCGGNIECAFDIAVTGNVEVGRTTLVEIVEHMAIVNESLPIICDPPCQNDAPCIANDTCNCKDGYTGSVCESIIIQCDTPCENGGICIGLEQCSCPQHYYGQYCSIYDPCVESPCEQGCSLIGNGSFICECNDGYFLAVDNLTCVKCAEAKSRGRVDPTWHVALCNANTNEMICSGTAINDQWILTSAGCVCDSTDKQSLSIRFGKTRTCFHNDPQEVQLSAAEVYCYPNYNPAKLSLDFALIKLQSAISLDSVKRSPPLCLTRRQGREYVQPGQNVMVHGWGRIGEEVPEDAVLQSSGMVTIANLSECMEEFKSDGIRGSPNRMMCTMSNTTSACIGDYGSGVVSVAKKNMLFLSAVVSKSTKSCGTDQSFLVHSKTKNIDFINWHNNVTSF